MEHYIFQFKHKTPIKHICQSENLAKTLQIIFEEDLYKESKSGIFMHNVCITKGSLTELELDDIFQKLPNTIYENEMIHTTIGIYNNGDYKVNGVPDINIAEHIKYNIHYRFGRALIVDGLIIYPGYFKTFNNSRLLDIVNKLSNIKQTKNTQPYK